MLSRINPWGITGACGCLLIVTVLLALGFGSVDISFEILGKVAHCTFQSAEYCADISIYRQIVLDIRLPRILMALLTGAGLSVAGLILQIITRNPLADPYLFGISAGAGFGSVVVSLLVPVVSVTVGAFAGAVTAIFLMVVLAGKQAVLNVERLLLSGVAVSFMLSAMTSLVLFYSSPNAASNLLFWMMGSFSNAQWHQLPSVVGVFGGCMVVFFIYGRWLSAIAGGEESALTLGIPIEKLRFAMLILCALLTAILVAYNGGIGFVGLMIPHITRYMVGLQVRMLVVMSALIGGIFMVWVDVLATTLIDNQVLPIGVVTSVMGSLFFFAVLKRRG